MARYKNRGTIPRILITEAGDYVRCAPGETTGEITLDRDNPVMRSYLARGGGVREIKPKAKPASLSEPAT